MRWASLAFALPSCLVAFALVAGGAACDSTLNLGNADDASSLPDSAPPTCASVCDRLITTCALFAENKRSECLSECNAKGRPSDLACVAQTPCENIGRVCGDGTLGRDGSTVGPDGSALNDFEIRNCQQGCDSSQFFDCITAAELSTCRDLCTTAPAARRNAYQSCANGAGGNCPKSRSCFDVFVGD